MTRTKIAASIGAGAVLLAGGGTLAYMGTDLATTAATTSTATTTPQGKLFPPQPLVGVAAVDSTSITLDWGPSQPGELTVGAVTSRSMVINWGASQDTLHPNGITYSLAKNGTTIISGLTRLYSTVGFNRNVRQFRACVTATSSTGKKSPPMCSTFTGA